MDALEQRVQVARRRLNFERFLGLLFRAWCVWLVLAVIAIAVRKYWPFAMDEQTWTFASLATALAGGLVTALLWTYLTRKSKLDAALEIDRRFNLKERVSTALGLDTETRETPAGQAILADALRRVEQLDVRQHFQVRLDRSAWWPLAPGVIAVLVALFISARVAENPALATTAVTTQQIKKTTQVLQKKLEQRREEARQQGLKEADALLKKLEEKTRDLNNAPPADKQKALVKLNDLAKQLQDRQQKLPDPEKMREQLDALKDLKNGPAEKVARAMKDGDFAKAKQAIEDLEKKLADDKLAPEDKEKLADQLKQMKDAMDQVAQAHEQARQAVQQQLADARKAGDTQQADKLQQQLDKLNQQQANLQQLDQLGMQCEACANALKQGNGKQAQQALQAMKQQLDHLAQAQGEMQMLNEALDEIAGAKLDINEPEQAGGNGLLPLPWGGNGGSKAGTGRGGLGTPPPPIDAKFYDSKVNQEIGRGSAQVAGQVDGPNKKGEVTESIKSAFDNAQQSNDDPLTGERLPRDYRDHAKEYFDAFRKGQ